MSKDKKPIVDLFTDESCEMAKLVINGKIIKTGNYWDFSSFETLEDVLKILGIKLNHRKYKA